MAIATRMQNPSTLANSIGYEGFSWTCFFFGPFPPLFRGDFLGFLVMAASAAMTFGLSGLVWIFVYNRWHYNRLLAKGFVPANGGFAFSQNISFSSATDVHYDKEPVAQSETWFSPSSVRPVASTETPRQIKSQPVTGGFGKRQSFGR
jgi:hypothetical protein